MKTAFLSHIKQQLTDIHTAGLYKSRACDYITPAQQSSPLQDGQKSLILCANNYLGLGRSPSLIEAGKKALDQYGFGMSSVRFICGTQTIHKNWKHRSANF